MLKTDSNRKKTIFNSFIKKSTSEDENNEDENNEVKENEETISFKDEEGEEIEEGNAAEIERDKELDKKEY